MDNLNVHACYRFSMYLHLDCQTVKDRAKLVQPINCGGVAVVGWYIELFAFGRMWEDQHVHVDNHAHVGQKKRELLGHQMLFTL